MEIARRGFFAALAGASGSAGAAELLKNIPEPTRVQAIEPSPDRAYVIECEEKLSQAAREAMQKGWKNLFGAKAPKLIVLDRGLHLRGEV